MSAKLFLWIVLACVLITIGSACQSTAEPEPPTEELLLTLEQLPPSWETSSPPRSMGPHIGFGDEDDSYVSFTPNNDDANVATHYVLYYRNQRKVEAAYHELSRSQFNSNSIAVDKPWEPVPELPYTSTQADQFRTACTINNIAGRRQVCQVMAQYGQYITIFHSVIGVDFMTLQQFNSVIQAVDETMVNQLQYNRQE